MGTVVGAAVGAAVTLRGDGAGAESALDLTAIQPEMCLSLLPDPEKALAARAPDLANGASFGLLVEAVTRQCGAIGAITVGETGRPSDATRSPGADVTEDGEAERLAREARYYFDTAMQIDPDAANDLLRRLLGRDPIETD